LSWINNKVYFNIHDNFSSSWTKKLFSHTYINSYMWNWLVTRNHCLLFAANRKCTQRLLKLNWLLCTRVCYIMGQCHARPVCVVCNAYKLPFLLWNGKVSFQDTESSCKVVGSWCNHWPSWHGSQSLTVRTTQKVTFQTDIICTVDLLCIIGCLMISTFFSFFFIVMACQCQAIWRDFTEK
jgi:hypothetical protein